MLSFRHSMDLIAVAALAVAIGMFVDAHQTSNPCAHNAIVAVESPIGDLKRVAVKAPPEHRFPLASTYADKVANTNHEGF
jgi:hypothetical protein